MTDSSSTAILGVSADFHDAAAALVVDGEVVAAAEEERFTGVKHDPSLPRHAIAWCLAEGGIGPGDLGELAFYEKPLSTYDRVLTTHAGVGPRGFRSLSKAVSSWSTSKLWLGYRLERLLRGLGQSGCRTHYAEHHQSHAASAFYPSPFERAAIVVLDGVGEWASTSVGWGAGGRIEMRLESRFPDSVGLFYSAMTSFCGFAVNDGEYKLMGLAPFGEPRFTDELRDRVIRVFDDGSFRMDQSMFDYRAGAKMTAGRLAEVFGGPPRRPHQPLEQRHADIARSVQAVVEDIVVRTARHAQSVTGERALCLAGGVALNCVANERVLADGAFDDVWVQPAAGDSGGSIGAALWLWHQILDRPRPPGRTGDAMSGALLGPSFDNDSIRSWLEAADIEFDECADEPTLTATVAELIADGALVGWFQGRMEFGPRALGHRSILGDPRDVANVDRINTSIKGREGFRPLAPAVLAERAGEWFALDRDLPYMTVTAPVHDRQRVAPSGAEEATTFGERLHQVRSTIPACTHVDGSARVQTVDRRRHRRFHALLRAFEDRTGCPVLINTSFNRAGEPIVRSPADALRCFQATDLDVLVLERCIVRRSSASAST